MLKWDGTMEQNARLGERDVRVALTTRLFGDSAPDHRQRVAGRLPGARIGVRGPLADEPHAGAGGADPPRERGMVEVRPHHGMRVLSVERQPI